MFESLQILSNTTKHDQTAPIQGVQMVKCLTTKQCLMVFGRQTFIVCPGPKTCMVAVNLLKLCFSSVRNLSKMT